MTAIGSTMRLVDPVSGSELLSVGPFTDTVLNKLELGFPDVRSGATSRSGGNGTVDSTKWTGARAISADMTLPQGAGTDDACDLIAGLCDPSLRLYLYAQRPNWPGERRILVRGQTFTCPPGTVRVAQVGFVAPGGLFEDTTLNEAHLSVSGGVLGRKYPRSHPWSYSPGLVSGAAILNVGGKKAAPPVISIYGPCSDPVVRCVDTGELVAFPGFSLAYGDYLQIDMDNRTVLLNGDPTQNRLIWRDFTTSTWWALPATSSTQVVFSATAPGVGCQAVIQWRSRWL